MEIAKVPRKEAHTLPPEPGWAGRRQPLSQGDTNSGRATLPRSFQGNMGSEPGSPKLLHPPGARGVCKMQGPPHTSCLCVHAHIHTHTLPGQRHHSSPHTPIPACAWPAQAPTSNKEQWLLISPSTYDQGRQTVARPPRPVPGMGKEVCEQDLLSGHAQCKETWKYGPPEAP